jgi:thymidylate synthase (FAD)
MLETLHDWEKLTEQVLDPLGDGKSALELIDYMGGDLAVVNDARASFEKQSNVLSQKDVDLILYLISHKHYSPLRGTVFKFRVKAPIQICRQWWKHVVASSHIDDQLQHNEKSFRYTEAADEKDFYIPNVFGLQSKSNRQSSFGCLDEKANALAVTEYTQLCEDSYKAYQRLLELGVSREQARGVLVPAYYTSWVWTVSLQSLLNFIHLRKGHGAQSEIQLYAQGLEDLIAPIVPYVLAAFDSEV